MSFSSEEKFKSSQRNLKHRITNELDYYQIPQRDTGLMEGNKSYSILQRKYCDPKKNKEPAYMSIQQQGKLRYVG